MGTRNALVTVFLLLVAGAGLAWFLFRGDDGGGGRGSGAVRADSRGGAEGARASANLQGGEVLRGDSVAGGDGGSAREEARVDPGLLAESAPSASASAEPTPSVSGRVIDRFGQPIAGATVLAGNQGGFPLDYVTDEPLPPFVRRSVTTTDAQGRYELEGVAPPSLRMLVRAPGFVPYEKDTVPLGQDALVLSDVVLEPGGVIEGLVVDPFGRGVAGAELFLEETSGVRFRGFVFGGLTARPSAVTDEQGRFRIDEMELGAWRVRVESADHPEKSFEGIAERAGQPVNRTFELELGDSVAGRVVDVPEAEKAELVVFANRPREGGFFGFGGGSRQGKVAADGSFVVKGLRADSDYELQVRMREAGGRFGGFGTPTRSERVKARSGTAGVEIPYKPEASVSFQVVDSATEQPIEEFVVESGFRWREPLLGDDMRRIRTHPEGRVRIGNLRPDESPASLGIGVTAVGYRAWERDDVMIRSAEEVDLGVVKLDPLPMVNVTVVDAATGAPIEGARVSIEEQREEDGFGRAGRAMRFERSVEMSIDDDSGEPVLVGDAGSSAVTDADGLARLNSLEGKTAKLRVRREGFAPAEVADLALPEGKPFAQTIELGKGGTVVARVVDESGAPVSGVRLEHREPGSSRGFPTPFGPGGREEHVTGSAGEVTFENLAVGEHRFGIRRSGGGFLGGNVVFAMEDDARQDDGFEAVTVGEGTEDTVTLVRATQGSLAGRVTEVGAELAGANVRLSRSSGRQGGFDFGGAFGGDGGQRTDSSGRYRLDDVEPGEYTLTITHPKRRMPAEVPITIEPGENRKDVELPLSILTGRVVDEDGKPLAGVEVRASKVGGGAQQVMRAAFVTIGGPDGSSGGEVTIGDELGEAVHTDADGAYELRGVMADVPLVVQAEGKDLQPGKSREVTVAPGEIVKGIDLRLEVACSIRVEVLQADGAQANFAMVRATYLDDVPEDSTSDGAEDKRSFAQGGKTTLSGLRPGRWSVTVDPVGPGAGGDGPEPQEVKVELGVEPSLTFSLP